MLARSAASIQRLTDDCDVSLRHLQRHTALSRAQYWFSHEHFRFFILFHRLQERFHVRGAVI